MTLLLAGLGCAEVEITTPFAISVSRTLPGLGGGRGQLRLYRLTPATWFHPSSRRGAPMRPLSLPVLLLALVWIAAVNAAYFLESAAYYANKFQEFSRFLPW